MAATDTTADRRKAAAKRSRDQFAAVADIGEIPDVKDESRRESCRLDLLRFLVTYFPQTTGLRPFSADHERVIARLQTCVLDGGRFANAVYRGFAKTTISENTAIWATIYGHRAFVPVFGANDDMASGLIESIKLELSENDLLYEDFPEVCHAIRALEGKPQRCRSQTYGGRLTHIDWRGDTIVLPTIEGSVASGAIITSRGLMAGSRGLKHKRSDGTQQRPDFFILDDPQTDESASTPLQVTKRLNIVRKNILKMGGHNKAVSGVMNGTPIQPGDLVEQLLDPKKNPAWQSERIPMIRQWATEHETMWLGKYATIRNSYAKDIIGDQKRAHEDATAYYAANRAKMDAGCQVSWEHCYDHDCEISAIQHAYNMLIDDGAETFASECNVQPVAAAIIGMEGILTADQLAAKINFIPRRTVPVECSTVTAFIDVQEKLLFWAVVGWGKQFEGAVIDYGSWPEQTREYYTLRDATVTLQSVAPNGAGLEAAWYAGLSTLCLHLLGREWKSASGHAMKIDRCMIDANYGASTDLVYKFIRQSPHAAILLPSHGTYVGAASVPISQKTAKPGDRVGLNWMLTAGQSQRGVRHVIFDTNWWKSFVHHRLSVPMGDKSSLNINGTSPHEHRLFAEQLTAEYRVRTSGRGREVDEWKCPPGRDNHWLDCVVGCAVAASISGIGMDEVGSGHQRERRTFKLPGR